ncbi:hypothetical protein EN850_20780 [Mesorhizobium sp. M8A.F.Ca.ET.207.01.1.1]|uniref:hypothetical protein n=1 Tax=Mesorhizobium sp. M8A.F.Ca.ET.207.01.1.1 TaxID=2563968 RepID=UPI00109C8044|nr:hypothetical protein [Mesorhizobium sp. M8A.F.Ca.ET.207.01.1.1]TGQ79326.1 hypothetical protein EN850_20780 [Mesorhizobium sp. M8A.F.Ca.ET.207.01.1.1]
MTAKENKTERLHLLISPGEVTAIDDWGFKNRIRTKGEAVRRLCQIGLAFDAEQRSGKQMVREALDATASGIRALIEEASRSECPSTENLRLIAATLMGAMTGQLALYQDMVATDATASAMEKDGDVEQRIREAAELTARLKGASK